MSGLDSHPLEPSAEVQRRVLAEVSERLVSWGDEVERERVAVQAVPAEVQAAVNELDLETGGDIGEATEAVCALLARWTVHTTHPRYFGLFNPTPTFAGIAAELITAGFNPQLAVWSHAPAAVEMERAALKLVADRAGLPEAAVGSFTTGGAEANGSAVALALTRQFPGVDDHGLQSLGGQPVLYASDESHHAWLKIAHQAGLGRAAVHFVPVDEDLRMDLAALRARIAQDRQAGQLPFLLVATAGTTSGGVIDPLLEAATVADDEGLHYHVDAAWAGAAVLSDRLRPLLGGIERADSLTVDAHKWLSVPMGAGMFLTPHAQALAATYRVTAAYMPDPTDAAADPYAISVQWSRRFIGLKLFLTLATAGRRGYARQLEADAELGDRLRNQLAEAGWRIVNRTPLPVVCFVDPDRADDVDHHDRIAEAVVGSGTAWISSTSLAGQPALRACVISHRSSLSHLDQLVEALDDARASV